LLFNFEFVPGPTGPFSYDAHENPDLPQDAPPDAPFAPAVAQADIFFCTSWDAHAGQGGFSVAPIETSSSYSEWQSLHLYS
jgi:hypothetical protein